MKRITVYGSLLEGLGNWSWFLNNSESKKLGEHILEGPFQMLSLGGFPGLIINEDVNNKIFVETYEVSDAVYKSVERLEGYPFFYDRYLIQTPFGDSEVYILASYRYKDSNNLIQEDENGIINWKTYHVKPTLVR
jgi:gamma-glutamylcyclotransferase (GGCT)/AIG2-like uncharacterized protein YtfP